jgi:methanogenic corrinoid protein MtbC1
MNKHSVVFVTFNQVDNLGIGYLAAALSENGYKPSIIDIKQGKEEISKTLKRLKPSVVGFSVILQYHIW